MARLLTVHNAELNTASITIRTLQIEGRQVTLAVFRQLLAEGIINHSHPPTLRGVGWGHVNYQMEDYGRTAYMMQTYGRHINLIWQKGNELRRCIISQREPMPSFRFHDPPHSKSSMDFYERNKDIYGSNYEQMKRDMAKHTIERAAAVEQHQAECLWTQQRNTLVTPLFDLPQLFIAV